MWHRRPRVMRQDVYKRQLLEYMVECLDDTGFFTTPLKEVAEKTGMSEPEVDLALKTLQERCV